MIRAGNGGAEQAAPPLKTSSIIGWREQIALPDFGLCAVQAKIDTGARTSALHALDIERFERDGQSWVRFRIDVGHRGDTVMCEAPGVASRMITSSNGLSQERLIVKTRLQIGEHIFRAEFSLADRSDMAFPVLIGRTALRSRFLVNPGKSYLQSERPARARASR